MRAVRLIDWKREPEVQDVAEPEPGPGQVVVKVGGAGLCHSDLHLIHDFEPGMMPWSVPFTLGHENAGWVHTLGAGVSGWEVGEPVAVYGPWGCGRCYYCRQGMDNFCVHQAELGAAGAGLGRDGGMAPLMLVPSDRLLVPIGSLDPVEAAPMTDAALTPYRAVKRSLSLLVPGSNVVVIGAGGLGHMAIQILKHLTPARVIVVDRNPTALALAQDVGADIGVQAGDDAVDRVREATKGAGADVVIDLVGADATIALAAAVAKALGHVTLVGIAGGTFPFGFFNAAYEVAFAGSNWGTIPELIEVIALAEAGHLKVHVQRFDLDGAVDAYRQLADGKLVGRGVVVPT
jgi:alcohol dehydrogenase, propanol-preferring